MSDHIKVTPTSTKRKLDDRQEESDEEDVYNTNHSNNSTKRFSSKLVEVPFFTFVKENSLKIFENNHSIEKQNTAGLFGFLPDEILIKILKQLTIRDLGALAITNSRIRNFILDNFLIRNSGYQHLIRSSQLDFANTKEEIDSNLELFTSIGFLLKKCTFVFPTSERIVLLVKVLQNTYGIPTPKTLNYFDFSNFKMIFKFYAQIIHSFVSGWGDFESANLYTVLKDMFKIDYHVDKFLKSSLGSKQMQELLIRYFYRMICPPQSRLQFFHENIMWLISSFNHHSVAETAKLMIVVYGPLISIKSIVKTLPFIAWWDLTDVYFHINGLQDLGEIFLLLYANIKDCLWNKDYVLQLLTRIISTPGRWVNINVSTLLHYSGTHITYDFLRKKLSDEPDDQNVMQEVGTILCYINIVAYKFDQNIDPVVRLIDLLTEDYGEEVIDAIVTAYGNIIYDIDILNDEDDRDLEISEAVDSQLELLRKMMNLAYLSKQYN